MAVSSEERSMLALQNQLIYGGFAETAAVGGK
jgi:hypothetical protein